MATKTAVCPECGAAAGPGRYACAECGALLAAVGTMPRSWPTTSTTGAEQTVEATASAETAVASATPSASSPSGNGIAKRPRRTKAPAVDPAVAPAEAVAPMMQARPTRSKDAPPAEVAALPAAPATVEAADRAAAVLEPIRPTAAASMAHAAPDRIASAAA